MQILKVLLVVLVVVNLTTGLFFPKKKTVYVHHPPPVYQQPAVQQHTYSYYYQPIPYYYYEPVPVVPVVPVAPVAPAKPSVPPTHPPVVVRPVPCTKPSHLTHLSRKQALPVFEPVKFTGKTKNVEIVPSMGFHMGTKTDVIEVYKSPGKYIQLPPETVTNTDTKRVPNRRTKTSKPSARPSAKPSARPGARLTGRPTKLTAKVGGKKKSPVKTTTIQLSGDSANSNAAATVVPRAAPSLVDTASTGFIDQNSQAIESAPLAIDVRTVGDDFKLEGVTLPVNGEFSAAENAFTTVPFDAPLPDGLLNAKVLEQGSASIATSGLADESNSAPVDALTFPEVQQLLNELLKHEEFDEKRLERAGRSTDDAESTKTVEIDPQVSYSRVVRQ
ncbi:uncharacterized protein LOC125773101 [Anopheles funestus]|uniref:uncharacterized protein LOC125773101 n=1 Tax=Anopheles funestus TaxID=62324 RepID=UPI0020C64AD3|nr:uncharacterized protein LOC125773101 [Anopheles funestus]